MLGVVERLLRARHPYEWVLELDAAYSSNSIDAPNEADESQALTYADIDTFLASF